MGMDFNPAVAREDKMGSDLAAPARRIVQETEFKAPASDFLGNDRSGEGFCHASRQTLANAGRQAKCEDGRDRRQSLPVQPRPGRVEFFWPSNGA